MLEGEVFLEAGFFLAWGVHLKIKEFVFNNLKGNCVFRLGFVPFH